MILNVRDGQATLMMMERLSRRSWQQQPTANHQSLDEQGLQEWWTSPVQSGHLLQLSPDAKNERICIINETGNWYVDNSIPPVICLRRVRNVKGIVYDNSSRLLYQKKKTLNGNCCRVYGRRTFQKLLVSPLITVALHNECLVKQNEAYFMVLV